MPLNSTCELDGAGHLLDGEVAGEGELSPRSPVTPVETKVIVGYLSTSRKSGDFEVAVAVVVAGVERRRVDDDVHRRLRGLSATVMVPWNDANRPRTLLTMRWRAEKLTDEWDGSSSQIPAGISDGCLGRAHVASLVQVVDSTRSLLQPLASATDSLCERVP